MNFLRTAFAVTLLTLSTAQASAEPLQFQFDFETARVVSQAISSGDIDSARVLCERPDGKAMIRKLRYPDCAALLQRFSSLRDKPQALATANMLAAELSKLGYGRYASLATEVARQLKQYVPADFSAQLSVRFIFGSQSGGFAFDDVPDDVYVDLMRVPDATTQELAELVAHELFHAVQTHVMRPETLPTAAGPAASTGPVWLNHLLVHLEQEGTAELFTHQLVERPATPYSAQRKAEIERNSKRIGGILISFETLGWRMLLAPPPNEDGYDRVYNTMFTTDFDEIAYDLGRLMAATIIAQDGRPAIFALLKQPPKQFVLRYQAIAQHDKKLPQFSADFLQQVSALQ